MTTMILAALIVLSMGVGIANAQSYAREMPSAARQGTRK
jgi:hypothetical protein